MAKKSDRIFAFVVAITFLLTTVGVGGLFIWQIIEDNKAAKNLSGTSQSTDTASTDASGNTKETKQMDNFTPVAQVASLQTQDLTVGDGQEVKAGDTVNVDYVGAVAATGAVFQSSKDFGEPISFSLENVIPGWRDGMVGMKINGVRRLLIPAAQAYGANPPAGSGIPANADLVFDVTLHKIGE